MIQRNRLEELIQQGTTIYKLVENEVLEYNIFNNPDLRPAYEIVNNNLIFSRDVIMTKLEDLYETKEDAEEYLEFANIERTEKFPFIPYKEFGKFNNIVFESKAKIKMELAVWINSKEEKTIKLTELNDWSVIYFDKPFTRENYREALRVCKKLFLGV